MSRAHATTLLLLILDAAATGAGCRGGAATEVSPRPHEPSDGAPIPTADGSADYLPWACAAFCTGHPPSASRDPQRAPSPFDECPQQTDVPPDRYYVVQGRFAPGAYTTEFVAECTAQVRASHPQACCYAVHYPPGGRPLFSGRGEVITANVVRRVDWSD